MQTLDPQPGFVFLRLPVEEEKKTTSGILMMSKTKVDSNSMAEVVNIGTGIEDRTYEVGDMVLFKAFAATPLKLNDTEFVVVAAADILGTVVEVAP